jgi:hypothetical protein
MTIVISSPKVLALIEQISEITGEDAETLVLVAVRDKLARLDAEEAEMMRRTQAEELKQEL